MVVLIEFLNRIFNLFYQYKVNSQFVNNNTYIITLQ